MSSSSLSSNSNSSSYISAPLTERGANHPTLDNPQISRDEEACLSSHNLLTFLGILGCFRSECIPETRISEIYPPLCLNPLTSFFHSADLAFGKGFIEVGSCNLSRYDYPSSVAASFSSSSRISRSSFAFSRFLIRNKVILS